MNDNENVKRINARYPEENPAAFNYGEARGELLSLATRADELETLLKHYTDLESEGRIQILSVAKGSSVFQPTKNGIHEMSFDPADQCCIGISIFTTFENACRNAVENGWPDKFIV